MARIGERAGYSRGLADYHFTSKLRCSRLGPLTREPVIVEVETPAAPVGLERGRGP